MSGYGNKQRDWAEFASRSVNCRTHSRRIRHVGDERRIGLGSAQIKPGNLPTVLA
jgi:hypothetical protein